MAEIDEDKYLKMLQDGRFQEMAEVFGDIDGAFDDENLEDGT